MPGSTDSIPACGSARPTAPALPVIILTAFGDPTSVRKGYDAGADDFLQKPIDTPQLVLKVRAFLRLKSLHDESDRSRSEAQERARSLALLPRDRARLVAHRGAGGVPPDGARGRLASLIGAPICLIALYEPVTRTMARRPARPRPAPTRPAKKIRYVVRPEYRSLWRLPLRAPVPEQPRRGRTRGS